MTRRPTRRAKPASCVIASASANGSISRRVTTTTSPAKWRSTLETLELWKRTYPNHASPPNNLALKYVELGQFGKAAEEAREAIRLNPNSASGYSLLASALVGLNRLDEAKAIIGQALAEKLDTSAMRRTLYRIAFVQGDGAAMQRQNRMGEGQAG